jgi:hypothetical protein
MKRSIFILGLLLIMLQIWVSGSEVNLTAAQNSKVSTSAAATKNKDDELVPIRLRLRTNKKAFRVGEKIEVLAYLENESENQPYYVAKRLESLFVQPLPHGIVISILDDENKDVAPILVVDPVPGSDVIKIEEVPSRYMELAPNVIYGVRDTCDTILKPGKYRLKVTYIDYAALRWSKSERAALPMPVLLQQLVSNSVIITVSR